MKFCNNKKKRRATSCLLVLMLSFVLFSGTVFAATTGSTDWNQNANKSINWGESHFTPTSNPNTGSIILSGVASSSSNSTFTVKLYCRSGWLYSQLGNTYTITSDSARRFDPTTNRYVNGQPFRLVWPASVEADYKIVFTYASGDKQTVRLSDLNFYAK